MSTHNIGFYEDLTKIIFELSSNIIKYAPYFFCCLQIPGLLEILSHPIQKFYPVKSLPFNISQQLLFARRYVHAFHDICVCLCEMGLLTFGPDSMKQKELVCTVKLLNFSEL